jgi:hypothetical protein
MADVKVGKRHLKDFGDLTSLADNIRQDGLLHPRPVQQQHVHSYITPPPHPARVWTSASARTVPAGCGGDDQDGGTGGMVSG